MDAAEVGECRGSQHRVPLTRDDGHEGEDENCGGASGGHSQRKKNAAKPPMEVVTLAKGMDRGQAQGAAHIEKAIADIDRPSGQRQKQRDPCLEPDAGCPGEGKRPHNGNGGRIEAGQMPKNERTRSIENWTRRDSGIRDLSGRDRVRRSAGSR